MAHTQEPLGVRGDLSHILQGVGRKETGIDGTEELCSDESVLPGGEGKKDDIVLIIAARVESFWRQCSHDLKRNILDANRGADRILAGIKQVVRDCLPEKDHFGCCVLIILRIKVPSGDGPVTDYHVRG